ncbi:hypothetical protein CPB86DRAFT_874968 [Serendipita vermifera]|nr:hypothetical protein CPB86DRAFT_874968 [Serendipita vermifera]
MLPSHHVNSSVERPSSVKHYAIRSSDVLNQDMKITVEDDGKALWHKTRELTENEIVDYITDAQTNQIKWTIHQPKRGWYIRLRSPAFPPGAGIALVPPSTEGPRIGNDPRLTFGCQTLVPPPVSARPSVEHSYPPSRNSTSSQTSMTPSNSLAALRPNASARIDPKDVSKSLENIAENGVDITQAADPEQTDPGTSTTSVAAAPTRSPPVRPTKLVQSYIPPPKWQITHYSLQLGIPETGPLAGVHHHHHLVNQPSHAPKSSLLSRALAPLANLSHASSHHFVIQPIPSPAGPGGAPNAPRETQTVSLPFIAFTDSTPVLRATPSGTLSVDVDVVRNLGVEMAFWVTVSLAFLEFLRDRDGYLAATED